jgi:hypothetical protein
LYLVCWINILTVTVFVALHVFVLSAQPNTRFTFYESLWAAVPRDFWSQDCTYSAPQH